MSDAQSSPTLLRSALYLPANRASAVAKAREADCDAVILDLEDAVAPDAKAEAREAAVAAAREGGFGSRTLVIRTNAPDTDWGRDDLAALRGIDIDAVLVPKVSNPQSLRDVRAELGGNTDLWAMVETCQAFLALGQIAAGGKAAGLTAFVIGTNDLALEMRCALDEQRSAMLPLLTQAVVTARAYGLAVLDGVFNDLSDEASLARQCAQGAALGFDGKTLIHPRQLGAANAAFGPSPEAIEHARGIARAFALPENAGKGVIKHDGKMAELLHLREAERTLAQAELIAARTSW